MNIVGNILRAKFGLDRLTKVKAFREKCKDPLATQWAYLEHLLWMHEKTGFGRKHGFASIRSIQDFQEQVPIHTWESTKPYVDEVIAGNHQALFAPWEKVEMYASTSGTTGTPKFIPVTNISYRDYGKYWDHTWGNAIHEIPQSVYGKALYFPGDPEEGYLNGVPYGAITAKAYAQQNRLAKSLYPYPFQICKVKDYAVRHYTIMRIALEEDIRIIAIANPSTILKLFDTAADRAEDLIEDIRDGRLRYHEQMPEEFTAELRNKLRPNPARARQLKRFLARSGALLPRDYWPGPVSVLCFASGPMKLYLKQLKHYMDNYTLFDFGLLASEGRFSFPMGSLDKEPGCCLTTETNFFEFIPEDQIERSNPQVYTLDQLREGERYFIVVTNASGLYRYNISDLMQVTGFCEKVPLLAFCNKGRHCANITGEKITEYQVTESVRKAGEKMGYRLDDFVVCLHWDDALPYYSLVKGANGKDQPEFLRRFATTIEEELVHMNVEYRSKRKSMRLGPLTIKIARDRGYEDYEHQKQCAAHNIAQYKHAFLVPDPEFEARFRFGQQAASALDEHGM